jgi:hypothetical protein
MLDQPGSPTRPVCTFTDVHRDPVLNPVDLSVDDISHLHFGVPMPNGTTIELASASVERAAIATSRVAVDWDTFTLMTS